LGFSLISASVLLLLAAPAATTEEVHGKPIQLALFDPVQIVPKDQGVDGFRISLFYGNNRFVNGFDLGLVNVSDSMAGFQVIVFGGAEKQFFGWQVGGVGLAGESFAGWQLGILSAAGSVDGVQTAVFSIATHRVHGVQLGAWIQSGGVDGVRIALLTLGQGSCGSVVPGPGSGVSIGLITTSDDDYHGLQVGIINAAANMQGLQVGFINYAGTLRGFQLGLLNIIAHGGIPFFPIVNALLP
jgi:hypothetical protein